jgi:hypothetical protein
METIEKIDLLITDLKERIAFLERELKKTWLLDKEDREFINGKLLAYRYALKKIKDL